MGTPTPRNVSTSTNDTDGENNQLRQIQDLTTQVQLLKTQVLDLTTREGKLTTQIEELTTEVERLGQVCSSQMM
jgi:hypothetical protein